MNFKIFFINRIDVAMAFQILADVAKTNIDILETIQLLAQGRDRIFKLIIILTIEF